MLPRQRRVGLVRFLSRRLRGQLHDGVEFGIDLGDLFQMRLDDRFRTELFGADGVGQFGRRFHRDVIIHGGCRLRLTDQSRTSCRRNNARGGRRAQKIPSSPFVAHLSASLDHPALEAANSVSPTHASSRPA